MLQRRDEPFVSVWRTSLGKSLEHQRFKREFRSEDDQHGNSHLGARANGYQRLGEEAVGGAVESIASNGGAHQRHLRGRAGALLSNSESIGRGRVGEPTRIRFAAGARWTMTRGTREGRSRGCRGCASGAWCRARCRPVPLPACACKQGNASTRRSSGPRALRNQQVSGSTPAVGSIFSSTYGIAASHTDSTVSRP